MLRAPAHTGVAPPDGIATETFVNILVLGKGKSGTTVIGKTIEHSMPGSRFHMEPKTVGYLEGLKPDPGGHVVKLLYDAWHNRPRMLLGIVSGETPIQFDRIVVIVRDPRDLMISEALYRPFNIARAGRNTSSWDPFLEALQRKEADPASVSFSSIVETFNAIAPNARVTLGQGTGATYYRWIRRLRDRSEKLNVHVLRYEDFMRGEMQNLEQFLGFPLSENRDVGEWNRTLRSGAYDNWRRWFTAADVEELKPQLQSTLNEWGYGDDWELDPSPTISTEEASGYVQRIIEEAEARPSHRRRRMDAEAGSQRPAKRKKIRPRGADEARADNTSA
jgi:hypothetical protein